MRSLVVYSSQTGNTKKLAEAVYAALPAEKEIYSIDAAPDAAKYDFVAVGFWLKAGKPDDKAAAYLEKLSGKKVFLFATHGAAPDSEHVKNALKYAEDLAKNATVVGRFSCQGEIAPQIMEKIRAKPQPPPWIMEAPPAEGHPDENDITNLKRVVADTLGKEG